MSELLWQQLWLSGRKGTIGMAFIVALNRDRDSYQVARAVAEVGELNRFVTDYYDGSWPLRLPNLRHRRTDDISPAQVTTSATAFLAQLPYELKHRFSAADFPSATVESALGRTVARVAKKNPEADLLLYSGSARSAFEGLSLGRRVLFQYHPSPHFIERSMIGVDELEGVRPWMEEAELANEPMRRHHLAELAAADQILCASSFTRAGLLDAGAAADDVTVVPYGCPQTYPADSGIARTSPHFLFVGQGVRRKGLHLLIEAWRQAQLRDARLTVVASRLDPQIAQFAEGVQGLQIRSGLSRAELDATMTAADTLVLPSLVEGFGLVLGEGLSRGCRLIATHHTGLPDMALPDELSTVIEPGKIAPLRDALIAHRDSFRAGSDTPEAAVAAAQQRSWAAFRCSVRAAIGLSGAQLVRKETTH